MYDSFKVYLIRDAILAKRASRSLRMQALHAFNDLMSDHDRLSRRVGELEAEREPGLLLFDSSVEDDEDSGG